VVQVKPLLAPHGRNAVEIPGYLRGDQDYSSRKVVGGAPMHKDRYAAFAAP
jgi:hypothetical protein